MNLTQFSGVSIGERTYKIDFARDSQEDYINYGKPREKTKSYSTGWSVGRNIRIYKTYFVNNEVFAHCSDNKVRKLNFEEGISVSNKSFYYEPNVVSIKYNGENVPLIFNDSTVELWQNSSVNFSLPTCSCYTVFANTLFLANKNCLMFGEPFDSVTLSTSYKLNNCFYTDVSDGRILSLFPSGDKLYIICKHKILCLVPMGSPTEYTVNRCLTPYLDINDYSFCDVGDEGYFFSCNNFYKFSNGKVTRVNSILDQQNFSVSIGGFSHTGRYMVMIADGIGDILYCYNTFTGQEYFTEADYSLSKYQGYLGNLNNINQLNFSLNTWAGESWVSKSLDFSTFEPKIITEISVNCEGSASLVVLGDLTNSVLSLTNGLNQKKCTISSKTFQLSIENQSANFLLKDITIKYRI